MASLRARKRKDGSEYFAVLYRLLGKQTSTSFDDFESASRFCELATKFGPANALSTLTADTSRTSLTVEEYLTKHIDDLTGVDQGTVGKYRAYVRNDISPVLGSLPLAALTREDIITWIKGMQQPDEDGKKSPLATAGSVCWVMAGPFFWFTSGREMPVVAEMIAHPWAVGGRARRRWCRAARVRARHRVGRRSCGSPRRTSRPTPMSRPIRLGLA